MSATLRPSALARLPLKVVAGELGRGTGEISLLGEAAVTNMYIFSSSLTLPSCHLTIARKMMILTTLSSGRSPTQ